MNSFYFALGLHYLCRQTIYNKKSDYEIRSYTFFACSFSFYGMFSILIQEG